MDERSSSIKVARAAEKAHAASTQADTARHRKKKIAAARATPWCRTPDWAFSLGITPHQEHLLGKIYSFQLTTNKDGSTGEYRMSHATVAALLGIDRDYVKDLLTDLVKRGYLIKKSNGKNRPATYLVDEAACFDAAAANGFVFPDLAD